MLTLHEWINKFEIYPQVVGAILCDSLHNEKYIETFIRLSDKYIKESKIYIPVSANNMPMIVRPLPHRIESGKLIHREINNPHFLSLSQLSLDSINKFNLNKYKVNNAIFKCLDYKNIIESDNLLHINCIALAAKFFFFDIKLQLTSIGEEEYIVPHIYLISKVMI